MVVVELAPCFPCIAGVRMQPFSPLFNYGVILHLVKAPLSVSFLDKRLEE